VDLPESFVWGRTMLAGVVLGPDPDCQRRSYCDSDTGEALHNGIMPSLP